MVKFEEQGQLTQVVKWSDGTVDDPSVVVVACPLCGALVMSASTGLHETVCPAAVALRRAATT